jgi:hypothetical protein
MLDVGLAASENLMQKMLVRVGKKIILKLILIYEYGSTLCPVV